MSGSLSSSYEWASSKLLLVAAALVFDSGAGAEYREGKLGILCDDLKVLWNRGLGVQIAQLYELVIPGLILSRHVFQGLRRRLYCDGCGEADKHKLIYTRAPAFDVTIAPGHIPGDPEVVKRGRPPGEVFVVIVSPNVRHREAFPGIDGWLEHWSWVAEDSGLSEAPINWVDRYDKKLFSRP